MKLRTELTLIAISAMIGMVFGIGLAKDIDYNFFSAFGAMLAGIGALGTWFIAFKALKSWKVKSDYEDLMQLHGRLLRLYPDLRDKIDELQTYLFAKGKHKKPVMLGFDRTFQRHLLNVVKIELNISATLAEIRFIIKRFSSTIPESLELLSSAFERDSDYNGIYKRDMIINREYNYHEVQVILETANSFNKIHDTTVELKNEIRKFH